MDRMDLEQAFGDPPSIDNWPGVGQQPMRWITWRQEALVARLTMATEVEEQEKIMAQVMPAILPGRTWDEIQDVLDAEMMQKLISQASRQYKQARAELEQLAGNAMAGTAPASPPPAPTAPSSPPSLVPTGAPCGAS